MDRLADTFGVTQRLRLTCCFRCPRRVVFLASQINGLIRAAPRAPRGRVEVRTSSRPFETVLEMVEGAAAGGTVVFLARGNGVLLDFLQHVYGAASACEDAVDDGRRLRRPPHWVSPGMQRMVEEARREGEATGCTVAGYLARLRYANQQSPVDRTMVRILDTATKLDGPGTLLGKSAWIAWLDGVLRHDGDPGFLVATVHACKGQEYRHVILYEFVRSGSVPFVGTGPHGNLFGHHMMDADHPQEQNLLYIALTRSTEVLTLLMNRRTRNVVSPFLPVEMVLYSTELWKDEGEEDEAVQNK